MIQTLEPETPHDRYKHAYGFDHEGNVALAAGCCNARSQQIVQAENVHHVEILQPCPAEASHRWIPRGCVISQPSRQVNRVDAVLFIAPAEWRTVNRLA